MEREETRLLNHLIGKSLRDIQFWSEEDLETYDRQSNYAFESILREMQEETEN